MIEIRKDAISVKNAILAENEEFIYIIHYDTIILKMSKKTGQVLTLLPVSMSSQTAIVQGLTSLGFSHRHIYDKIFNLVEELNGVSKSELMKMWKHKRYSQPERRKKAEILEVVNELIGEDLKKWPNNITLFKWHVKITL